MSNVATTKLSSKGQVVIPESIRERLGLQTGDQFVVIAEGDVVILKTLSSPSMREFHPLVTKARKQAKNANLSKKGLTKIIKEARRK